MSRAVEVYLESLSKTSQQTMWFALRTMFRPVSSRVGHTDFLHFDWGSLTPEEIAEIRESLVPYSSSTANLYLYALRGVLRVSMELQEISWSQYSDLVSRIEMFEGESVVKGRTPVDDEVEHLLTHCRDRGDQKSARDALIIALLFRTSLRRADIVRLKTEDIEIVVPGTLGHLQTRDKPIFIGSDVLQYLDAWLLVRGTFPGWLVTRVDTLPRLVAIGSQTVYDVLKNRCYETSATQIRPIDFRRLQALAK